MLDAETEARYGPVHRVTECPGEHGGSKAFRVELKTGKTLFVKRLSARAFQQEVAFYRDFAPRLRHVPRLLEADQEKRTLLLTEISGTSVSNQPTSAEIYKQAGSFLGSLHSLEFQDPDEMPLKVALRKRLELFNEEAGRLLESEYLNDINTRIKSLLSDVHLQRVPCHRDFMEYNWILRKDGTVCFFDFEHARPDYWLLDLCKMNALVWLEKPRLKEAFFRGYGYEPKAWEESLLRLWTVIWSVGTLQWAIAHGDGQYERQGRTAAKQLGASLRPG